MNTSMNTTMNDNTNKLEEIRRININQHLQSIKDKVKNMDIDEINKLEKTEITETVFTNVSEKYRSFVLIGLIFFIIEIIARKTIFKSFV